MRFLFKKPFFVFCLAVIFIALPLFIFPINFFDGEIIMKNGLSETKMEAPLSLSYFIGFGFNSIDMEGIKDFLFTSKRVFTCILPHFWLSSTTNLSNLFSSKEEEGRDLIYFLIISQDYSLLFLQTKM